VLFNYLLFCCLCADGVVAYSVQQGDVRSDDLDFQDFTYDGTVTDGFLNGGLGQLTDGEEGLSNFRLDPQLRGKKGFEWVGWKRESFPEGLPVKITFRFDQLRNFTSVRLHCNNMFSKDVRVFRAMRVQFLPESGDPGSGPGSELPTVSFSYYRDSLIEYTREVNIRLSNNVARVVTISLWFDAKWILISEIEFVSGNYEIQFVKN